MGQEGGEVEPAQVVAQHGRCALCASSVKGRTDGDEWWVGKEGEFAHPNL